MGILDEAIRQHLELKRKHGARDDELHELEQEAFGPPLRPGEVQEPPQADAAEGVAAGERPPDLPRDPAPEGRGATREAPEREPVQELPPELMREEPAPPVGDSDVQAEDRSAPPAEIGRESAGEQQDYEPPGPPTPPPGDVDDRPPVSAQPPPVVDEAPPLAEEEPPPLAEEPPPFVEEPPQLADEPPPMDQEPAPLDDEPLADPVAEAERRAAAAEPDTEPDMATVEDGPDAIDDSLAVITEGESPLADFYDFDEGEPALADELEAEFADGEEPLEDESVQPLEEPLERDPAAPPVEPLEGDAPEPAEGPPAPAEPESDDESGFYDAEGEGEGEGQGDVLEETPDFLEETPEGDEMWFEQRPPKDFDFDA